MASYDKEAHVCYVCKGHIIDLESSPRQLGRDQLRCWPCRREDARNNGYIGPIFGGGGWY